jgi:hypothetical protein
MVTMFSALQAGVQASCTCTSVSRGKNISTGKEEEKRKCHTQRGGEEDVLCSKRRKRNRMWQGNQ